MTANTVPLLLPPAVSLRRVAQIWWPLAFSWLLMSVEGPAQSAVVARLAHAEINLAAWGGIVYPLALIIEAPIIMLLPASTALSRDWDSYVKLRRFMLVAGALLTALHVLVAFTPLYDVVVRGIMDAPEEIIAPGRIGLMLMTPWTWSIAFRRFNQGVLIRFGHSRAVGVGTLIRLSADALVLAVGYWLRLSPGIVVAAGAVATGVLAEALYAGLRVRPVLRDELRPARSVAQPLTFGVFVAFYVPLVLTSVIQMFGPPLGSAAMSRMPEALASLAVWPVLSGLIFILRSGGIAFTEVVVALLDEPRSMPALRRFAALLAFGGTAALLVIAATPLARFWFETLSALPEHLTDLARYGLWLALPLPALAALQSWFQGALVNARRTRGVTEAVALSLATLAALYGAGVLWGRATGLYVATGALSVATLFQVAWLWLRSRPVLAAAKAHDEAGGGA